MVELANSERGTKTRRAVVAEPQQPAPSALRVGAADDRAEQEAHAMSRSVVDVLRGTSGAAMALAEGDSRSQSRVVRRSGMGEKGGAIDAETESRVQRARGGGRPLDEGVQRQMGAAFGADFSSVRVHAGSESRDLNDRLGAEAFTIGSDVLFRDGVPDTTSRRGQELLAHELTHTLQQSGATVQRSSAVIRRHSKSGKTLIKTPIYKALNDDKIDETGTGMSSHKATPGDVVEVEDSDTRSDSNVKHPGTYVRVTKVGQKNLGRWERFIDTHALAYDGGSSGGDSESTGDKVGSVAEKIGDTAGILPDINDAQDAFKANGGGVSSDMESGLGVAAGIGDTVTMFTGIAEAIIAFRDADANASDKVGAAMKGIAAGGTGAKGISGIVDKAGGGDGATAAAQGIAGFADAFVGIKDTFFAIKHIVELVRNAPKMNDREKFDKSMEIVTEAMTVAKSGVSSAKAFMDLWGGGAGAPLVNAVPGFGIALAAVDIIIRTVALVDGMITRGRMQKSKRSSKKKLGGKTGKSSKTEAQALVDAYEAKIEAGDTPTPDEEEEYDDARNYLMAKGLQYVSQKRANRAILKISVAMGKMAGDIAVLGGASAPVGVGIKAGAMATDVGFSLFRRFKQWGRDKAAAGSTGKFFGVFNKDKSTDAKLAGYNRMVDQIFDMIIKASKISDPVDSRAAEKQVGSFVGAMGISMKQMDQNKSDPAKLREMMIKAMKKRE